MCFFLTLGIVKDIVEYNMVKIRPKTHAHKIKKKARRYIIHCQKARDTQEQLCLEQTHSSKTKEFFFWFVNFLHAVYESLENHFT